jgi:hypothetical protein
MQQSLTHEEPDLRDAKIVIDLFERAAQSNLDAPGRRGAVLDLPEHGRLVITGDLHDNALNYQRILKLARLSQKPTNHLILHEMIHGPTQVNGCDLSVRILARIAALKLQYPNQVHLLQANHELAQLGGEGILKDGASVVEAFEAGIDLLYANDAQQVIDAMNAFIVSLLLAVRCPNGVFCSHSLPSPRKLQKFDPAVIDRLPTEADLAPRGDAYLMVWGRNHTQELADALADAWGASQFVMGHQPAEMGYETQGQTMIILASDHSHGVALPIDLSKSYDQDALVARIVPLASVLV